MILWSFARSNIIAEKTQTLPSAPGGALQLYGRNKKLLLASLPGARTPLGAPGRTTRNKKLLGAPGNMQIALFVRSKLNSVW